MHNTYPCIEARLSFFVFVRRAFVLEAPFKDDEGTIQAQRERHDTTFRTKRTRKFNSLS